MGRTSLEVQSTSCYNLCQVDLMNLAAHDGTKEFINTVF